MKTIDLEKISRFNRRSTWIIIGNSCLFQIVWFICIFLDLNWALAFTLLALIAHVFAISYLYRGVTWQRESAWMLIFLFLGLLVETLFFSVGAIVYIDAPESNSLLVGPPAWLICLWLAFGSTARVSLIFVFNKVWLGVILGMLFVPASYVTGAFLNNQVALNENWLYSVIVIALVWSMFMACMSLIKQRWYQYEIIQ